MSPVCKKCSSQHVTNNGAPACVGHKRKTGAACRAHPVGGTALCSKHGGMTPSIRRKGEQRVAVAKVERTLGDLMAEHARPDEHPIEALGDMVVRMATITRWVDARLAALDADTPDDETQAAVAFFTAQAKSFAMVAKVLLDARIEERLVRLHEWQVERLFGAVLRAMRAANLTFEQQDAVRAALAADLLGDLTPEQQEQRAHDYWERHHAAYRGQALDV